MDLAVTASLCAVLVFNLGSERHAFGEGGPCTSELPQ